jgi:hypothetical protein
MTPLSVREQDRLISADFPSFRLCLDADWIGIWEGTLCPIAQSYRVRIVYFTRRQFPAWELSNPYVSVTVLDPPVGPDPRGTGECVPHIYGLGCDPTFPRLCLYDPIACEYRPDMPIAGFIIPWAIDWLFFFEEWVRTGVWRGGGRHPEVRSEPCLTQATSDSESLARQERFLNAAFHSLGRRIGHFGSYLWMEAAYAASSRPAFWPNSNNGISEGDPLPDALILSPAPRPAASSPSDLQAA